LYSLVSINNFLNFIGLEISLVENYYFSNDFRNYFLCGDLLVDETILNYIIVGVNLRIELPLLNSKFRRLSNKIKLNVFNFVSQDSVGCFINNNVKGFIYMLSNRNKMGLNLFSNKLFLNCFGYLLNYKKVNIYFGLNFFFSNNRNLISFLNKFFLNKFFLFDIKFIISNISYLNLLETGAVLPKINSFLDFTKSFIFLQNVDDEIFLGKLNRIEDKFVAYIGSFFDNGAKIANMVFPVSLFFEYNGLFLNLQAKLRKSVKVINPLFFLYNTKELFDSLLFFFIIKFNDSKFFFYKLSKFFVFFKFLKLNLNYAVFFENFQVVINYKKWLNLINVYEYNNVVFKSLILNYYKSDVVSKNSKNLSLASFDYLNRLTSLI
jgi:hypothetical protein